MKDWFPFSFAVVLMCSIVTGLVLFFQSLEVGTWEYQRVARLAKEYPEIRKDIDECMENGYISVHELDWIECAARQTVFNRAKQSVIDE